MANRTRAKKISYGKRRKRAINEYLENPVPIKDANCNQPFNPAPDECFVRLFHYKKTKIKNRKEKKGKQSNIYLVSNKGNVITFDSPENPKVMKYVLTNKERGDMSYLKCGDNWDIHRVVWFSFAADSVINNTARPTSFKIHESFWTIEGLLELADLGSEEYGELVVVHHKDENPQNNNLSNLELLPNNKDDELSEAWHTWLHNLQNLSNDEKLKTISQQKKITEPTIIYADRGFLSASDLNSEQLNEIEQKYSRITRYRVFVLGKIANDRKDEYLTKKRNISVQTDQEVELDRFSAVIEGTTLIIKDISKSEKIDCFFAMKPSYANFLNDSIL